MKTPLVSIVVPVYRSQAYLKDCVDSLLAQTYSRIEVILVDDGSPDRSGQICDEYAQSEERVSVYHIQNSGAAHARLFGVKKAQGEWILFSDSDDYMRPSAVEDLLSLVTNDVSFIACPILYRTLGRQINSAVTGDLKPVDYIGMLLERETYVGPCCKLIRRSLFDCDFSFISREIVQYEDMLMIIVLVLKANLRVRVSNEVVPYECITRENSASWGVMPIQGWVALFSCLEKLILERTPKDILLQEKLEKFELSMLCGYCIPRRMKFSNDNLYVQDLVERVKRKPQLLRQQRYHSLLVSEEKRKLFYIYLNVKNWIKQKIGYGTVE